MENDNMKEEFFIIESDNLEEIDSKLYGYVISENNIHISENFSDSVPLTGDGAYVYVNDDVECITIYQDYMGSYGLYLYENGDYFALSNSFIKLEEYLKERFLISINENYVRMFLSSENITSFNETLINEISLIPENYKITINKKSRKINLFEVNYHEKSIKLNEKEGLQVLDKWFNRWINIFKNLKKENNSFSLKLNESDSSMAILVILCNVFSNFKDTQPFELYLNNAIDEKVLFNLDAGNDSSSKTAHDILSMDDFVTNNFNTKLGFNKNYYGNESSNHIHFYLDNKTYFDYPFNSINDFINISVKNSEEYFKEFALEMNDYYWDIIHKVQKHSRNFDMYSDDFLQSFVNNTIHRNTIGKDNVEKYLLNKIILNPLLDVDLQKLTIPDKQFDFRKVFFTTIILRYCPDLIEHQYIYENIDSEIIQYVQSFLENNSYVDEKSSSLHLDDNISTEESEKGNIGEMNQLITKVFFSNSFKHSFLKYYPSVYDKLIKKYAFNQNKSVKDLYAAICVVKVLADVEYSSINAVDSEFDWLKSFVTHESNSYLQIPSDVHLKKYMTARVDIKNNGSVSNQVKLYDISDETANITSPQWFTNDKGVGMCISSDVSDLSFKIKCINDGILQINLRTLDIRDRDNKRFPVYIDYLSFKIDDDEFLKDNKLVWHDKPINFSKKVYNNEVIKIHLKWRPFTHLSKFE